jgi:hypothetical protein
LGDESEESSSYSQTLNGSGTLPASKKKPRVPEKGVHEKNYSKRLINHSEESDI